MQIALPETSARAPFPRIFFLANGLELLERLAFYGVFVNLAVYLTSDVRMTEIETTELMGLFAIGRSWLPVAVGGVADRIGFRTSLLVAFSGYVLAYGLLYSAPTRPLAYAALGGMSVGGAFMKPVITGCVKRYAPAGRQAQGFAIFYATVNAGSVVGKTLAKNIRMLVSLRATMLTSVASSAVALVVAALFFFEPKQATSSPSSRGDASLMAALPATPATAPASLADYGRAFRNVRLVSFLMLVSGYYLLIEQFYQTFPIYIVRTLGPSAPREYITLVNPLAITLLQLPVARLTRGLAPLTSVALGVAVSAVSMLAMGAFPTLAGACASFFVFAIAEMIFSPRYYEYVASFAPKGREALYMGIALAPMGAGGLAGGFLSGRLITAYLPKDGPKYPLAVWGTYAAIGLAGAAMLAVYAAMIARRQHRAVADTKL